MSTLGTGPAANKVTYMHHIASLRSLRTVAQNVVACSGYRAGLGNGRPNVISKLGHEVHWVTFGQTLSGCYEEKNEKGGTTHAILSTLEKEQNFLKSVRHSAYFFLNCSFLDHRSILFVPQNSWSLSLLL